MVIAWSTLAAPISNASTVHQPSLSRLTPQRSGLCLSTRASSRDLGTSSGRMAVAPSGAGLACSFTWGTRLCPQHRKHSCSERQIAALRVVPKQRSSSVLNIFRRGLLPASGEPSQEFSGLSDGACALERRSHLSSPVDAAKNASLGVIIAASFAFSSARTGESLMPRRSCVRINSSRHQAGQFWSPSRSERQSRGCRRNTSGAAANKSTVRCVVTGTARARRATMVYWNSVKCGRALMEAPRLGCHQTSSRWSGES